MVVFVRSRFRLSLVQALKELEIEGGVSARACRYKENQRICQEGMKKLGFELYLDSDRAVLNVF